MKTVLFACVHNAGRSQMAAAWFNMLADPGKARGISAGTDPGLRVHPGVVAAMKEVGVDLSAERPRVLSDELARTAMMLVTMGCGEACPAVPGLRRADWPLEDPKGKPVERVRQIRDDIRERVAALVEREGWARPPGSNPDPGVPPKRVLFLCTGNSARSQIAEAVLRHLGGARWDVSSAGIRPRPHVHPEAVATLERHHVPVKNLFPKDLAVFSGQAFDFVITVCDRALEQCPVFPGADMIHWSFPDPAEASSSAQRRVFDEVFTGITQRIRLLLVVNGRT